jgi:hypothetical protein
MGRYAPKQADLNKTCHHFAEQPEVDFGARLLDLGRSRLRHQ